MLKKIDQVKSVSPGLIACAYREDDLAFLFISKNQEMHNNIMGILAGYHSKSAHRHRAIYGDVLGDAGTAVNEPEKAGNHYESAASSIESTDGDNQESNDEVQPGLEGGEYEYGGEKPGTGLEKTYIDYDRFIKSPTFEKYRVELERHLRWMRVPLIVTWIILFGLVAWFLLTPTSAYTWIIVLTGLIGLLGNPDLYPFRSITSAGCELLGLDKDSTNRLFIMTSVAPVIYNISTYKRVSMEERDFLLNAASIHGINVRFSDKFQEYYELLELEQGAIPETSPIPSSLNLSKGEQCYFACNAEWMQPTVVKSTYGYVGGSIKGFGAAIPLTYEGTEIKSQAHGRLNITNKRIIFVGENKSTNITAGRVLRIEMFTDAIKVNKTSGKPDIFMLSTKNDAIKAYSVLMDTGFIAG